MPPLLPHQMDELREIAKALGDNRRERSVRARSWPAGALAFGVVTVAAVLALAWLKPEPCRSARCGTPGVEATARDRVAVALAPYDDEPDGDADDRFATTEIGSLLAAERGAPEPRAERQPRPVARATPQALAHRVVTRPVPAERETVAARKKAPDRPAPAPEKPVQRDRDAGYQDRDSDVGAETPSLSGRWLLTNAIDETDVPAFAGLRIRFRVRFEQHGDRIVGRGEKFTVDDKPVPASQRSPIELEGTVRGREVVVHFVEHGSRRSSSGGMRWRLSPDGERLQGMFGSDAAGARGRSHASRDG